LLRRKTGGLGQHGITAVVLKSIVASGVMALAVLPLLDILHRVLPAGLLYELLLVATSGSAGTAVFVLMAVLMRMDDISILGRLLVDKLRVLTGLGR
ncbi:MAG: hypothetical protein GX620_14755, partial [Chloroflexi bacterium]|nr:hypothetical protein [Chloroflexota bacterium]